MPGSIVASYFFAAGTTAYAVTAFAVNMVASAIVARVFAPDQPTLNSGVGTTVDPGARITAPPAGDNKLPVIYGTAYTGGVLVDMSISSNNQVIYYVIALSEVTNTETGGTPDTFTFGNVYWGGKRVVFDGTDLTKVNGLLDESTGLTDTSVAGKMNFYLSAADEQLKSAEDNPSIGIILCKNKNKLEVEYALRGLSKAIGVSEFSLTQALPTELRSTLPTVEEFENELKQDQI
jgi:hypothetical protein